MTKIDIQNQKLIVTDDYHQFLAYFEWFLSLFQFSDVKHEFLLFKLKVHNNGIFWAKNLILKIFPRLLLSPNSSYVKNCVKMASKLVFLGGGGLKAPPAVWDAFQMLLLEGLM